MSPTSSEAVRLLPIIGPKSGFDNTSSDTNVGENASITGFSENPYESNSSNVVICVIPSSCVKSKKSIASSRSPDSDFT